MSEASDLLFGPRQPRQLSEKQRKDRAEAEQRYEEKKLCDQFSDQAATAREALLTGDGLPLAEVLQEKKSEVVRETENDFVEGLVAELYNRLAQSRQDPEPLVERQSLTGLIALVDKCQGREMIEDESLVICHRYGAAMANEILFKELKEKAEAVGLLPAVSYDHHYKAHIPVAPAGYAVCGATLRSSYTSYDYNLKAFIHSAATALIDCERCLDLYQRKPDKGATLNPAEWIEMFDELKYSYWGDCFDLGTGGFIKSGADEERAAALINYYYDKAKGRLGEMLAAVDKSEMILPETGNR